MWVLAWASVAAAVDGDDLYRILDTPSNAGLAAQVIEDHGLKRLPDGKYYSDLGGGQGLCLSVRDEDGRPVSRVWLQDNPRETSECPPGTFAGALPFGLAWGMPAAEVEAILGPPHRELGLDVWADERGGHLIPFYNADRTSLRALKITDKHSIPIAASKWFAANPTLPEGALPAATGPAAVVRPPPELPPLRPDDFLRAVGTSVLKGVGKQLVDQFELEDQQATSSSAFGGERGICLDAKSWEGGKITRIQLQDHVERDKYCPAGTYQGPLPYGLAWGMLPDEVETLLGPPKREDGQSFWTNGRGVFLKVAYDQDRGVLDTVITSLDGSLPTAATDWFASHPSAKVGKLPATSDVVALVPAPAAAPAAAPKPAPVVATRLPVFSEPARTKEKATNEAAVVIGLEAYPFLAAGVPYAGRDADAFAELLTYTRGVPAQRIQSLRSGAREQIVAAVDRAAAEVGPGGTVWVYFAGHGAANPESGERMVLGDDVRADVAAFASRGVAVSELEQRVAAAGARPMLVLDTCYAGASRSGASIGGGTRLVVPGYAMSATKVAGAQWNAADANQVSGPLDEVRHGAFTYFVVGALRGWADGELDGARDGAVTAAEAQAYVTRALRRKGKLEQQPVYLGDDALVLTSGVTEVGPAL